MIFLSFMFLSYLNKTKGKYSSLMFVVRIAGIEVQAIEFVHYFVDYTVFCSYIFLVKYVLFFGQGKKYFLS